MVRILRRKNLLVDFGNISKSRSQQLIQDKVELSLFAAEKFLKEMCISFTLQDEKRTEFEILSEGFLYFMIGARDALLQEINSKRNLCIDINKVKLDQIKNKLLGTDPKNKKIKQLLDDCTQMPSPPAWSRANSWLWEINHLRNRIGHQNILNKNVAIGGGPTTVSMIISRNVLESDPIAYFISCYRNLVTLKNDIRRHY